MSPYTGIRNNPTYVQENSRNGALAIKMLVREMKNVKYSSVPTLEVKGIDEEGKVNNIKVEKK